jgi:polysaccharide export outer membrane protein
MLFSCRSLTSSRMFETPANYKYTSFSKSEKEYIIQPYDKLSIKIFTNKADALIDMSAAKQKTNNLVLYNVEYDGMVKIPTLGRINLKGLTIREAEGKLEKEYKAYLNDPFVFVEVVNKRIFIFTNNSEDGKVIQFSNEKFTLIEALAKAGGVSEYGKTYKIKLLRGDLNNPEIFLFNIRRIEDVKNANFQLQANDIIYVESRSRYAAKTLQEITPYLTLFTTFFTIYLLIKK